MQRQEATETAPVGPHHVDRRRQVPLILDDRESAPIRCPCRERESSAAEDPPWLSAGPPDDVDAVASLEREAAPVRGPVDVACIAAEDLLKACSVRPDEADAAEPAAASEGDHSAVWRPIGIGIDCDEGDP